MEKFLTTQIVIIKQTHVSNGISNMELLDQIMHVNKSNMYLVTPCYEKVK